jgi:DNA-binding NarL/FixJ family response regulator
MPEPDEYLQVLTERERLIAKRLADGYTIGEIGKQLGIAASTVAGFRQKIMLKLRLSNRAELALFAINTGITSLHERIIRPPKPRVVRSPVLTERERLLAKLLVDGQDKAVIAARLGIKSKSVTVMRYRLMRKFDLPDHAALVRYASEIDITSPQQRRAVGKARPDRLSVHTSPAGPPARVQDVRQSVTMIKPRLPLTKRDREVLKLLADGYQNHEIAETLGISPHTVESNRAHLMLKLGLHDLASLVKYAIQLGLTTTTEHRPSNDQT